MVSNRCSNLRNDDWDGDLTLYDTSVEAIFADRARRGFCSGGGDLDPHLRRAAPMGSRRSSSGDGRGCLSRRGSVLGPDARGSLVMRLYDDPVEVRRGLVNGVEAPAEFVWRGRLWVVHEVIAHWMETGAWWVQAPAEDTDLIAEREVWRVGASRSRAGDQPDDNEVDDRRMGGSRGVFDLSFDWSVGHWQLARAHD
jgi:hypothetical protein